jgi:hypothetical protein
MGMTPLFLAHFEREFPSPVEPSGKELNMKKSRYTEEHLPRFFRGVTAGRLAAPIIPD